MIQDLEQIEYRKGMLDKGMKAKELPVKAWRCAKIPADVRKAINEEDLLNLGGVYGDKDAGYPVEYDQPKVGPDRRHCRYHGFQPRDHAIHVGRRTGPAHPPGSMQTG